MDFLGEFEEAPSVAQIETALAAIASVPAEEYVEKPECGSAIAAAELIAAAKALPLVGQDFEASTKRFLASIPPGDRARLTTSAIAAVDRIAADSELKELWDEAGGEDASAWRSSLADLRGRLAAS